MFQVVASRVHACLDRRGRAYLADAIRDGLRLEAIAADIAGDGDTALELLSVNVYDIAVLDRDIPGPSGDEIARRLVASGSGTPILMLTAADRLDDKASGFELGADDYLTKPFELRELVLRLRALNRRRGHSRPPVREIAGVRVDPFRREVYRDGRYVALTRKQFAVLDVLVAAEGGVVSAEELLAGPGTSTPIRSPTPCGSPSRRCASASANPGSSPPCAGVGYRIVAPAGDLPVSATVDRQPGLSVRLKLTSSYAGFLVLTGFLMLVAAWVAGQPGQSFDLLRYAPDDVVRILGALVPGRHAFLLRAYAPAAAVALAFLLVVGLAGGWLLAGRMLAALRRITDATRLAAQGTLAHRIRMPGRGDEFRELADAFDGMLTRLEAHVAEQRRFAANASHELRTPLTITKTLLDVARTDPDRDVGELVDRLQVINARAIELTEALLVLSRADQRSFAREPVDLSLVAEEATEALLLLAETHGITVETASDAAPTVGSHALLLQMVTNLVHNAIVHNLPGQGAVWVRTTRQPEAAVLTVENTGEPIDPSLVSTLVEPFRRGTERIRTDHAGVGLGLAIVRSITLAHDGSLTLTPRPAGGLRVVVELPAVRTAQR